MNLDFLMAASGPEKVFWAFALFGTLFFVLRVAYAIVGGFGMEDAGHGDASVADAHHDTSASHDSDAAFKLISLNSITGFIMMFGWVGLAATKDGRVGAAPAIVAALAAGALTMLVTAHLFRLARGLVSSGEQFAIGASVGAKATVYVRIPADGRGQVQLSANGTTRTVEAVSEDKVELDSFVNVNVVRVVDNKTVAVRKA